ncbi:MAG: ribonuclease H-like domain-containing protein [Deltaproteobacteria bacterium]|nr:ribonuclease H-like domain-containing protein [Deltaproteobacteria bacterium]
MSKLHNRLSRRKQKRDRTLEVQGETSRREDGAVENFLQSDGEPPDAECEDEPIAGTKSEIIAQLQKRMKKIESSKVHALGTRNRRSQQASELPTDDVDRPVSIGGSGEDSVVVEPDSAVILPGEVLHTAMGEVWLSRQTYPGYYMGNEPVNRYLETGRALAAFAKDTRIAELPPEGALFIDTETTGLSGGVGTLPFLIGAGYFEDGVFVVEQYFCREPSEEPAQLEALANRMEQAAYLVTFNGKSFDMPLINTRFIVNKVKNPGYNLPHLDLLHVSRRIFKRRLSDRSLQNLEKVILGFTREGDIPGSEIPAAYREYLFGAGAQRICDILAHNLLDIVALAALGGVLDKIYSDPLAVAHAADNLGLAREAFGAGEKEIGNRHLDAADALGDSDDKRIALHMKGKEAMRRKAFDEAIDAYRRVLDVDAGDVDAHLQLAKLYEHRKKDYESALRHAEQAAELEGADGAAYRVARIQKKKDKHAKRKW